MEDVTGSRRRDYTLLTDEVVINSHCVCLLRIEAIYLKDRTVETEVGILKFFALQPCSRLRAQNGAN
jgi:hypothetical protein